MRLSASFVFCAALTACGACGSPSEAPATKSTERAPEAAAPANSEPAATPSATSAPSAPVPAAPAIPAALGCLAKHYVGTPIAKGAGFALRLPDGVELAWDDGKTKTYDEMLAQPDLQDTLAMPYTLGPITPIATVNQDPGRVRSDALLKATFGASESAVTAKLVDVSFVGQNVRFHGLAAAALARVSTRLQQAIAQTPSLSAYVSGTLGGTFNWRPIVNTDRMSAHSYGIAIDVVVSKSNYWEWEKQNGQIVWHNQIPQAIVDAFEAEGFAWGGRWYHYDTMHFEYRPELFDKACAL